MVSRATGLFLMYLSLCLHIFHSYSIALRPQTLAEGQTISPSVNDSSNASPVDDRNIHEIANNTSYSAPRSLYKRVTGKRKRPLDPGHEILEQEVARRRKQFQKWFRESIARGITEMFREYSVLTLLEIQGLHLQLLTWVDFYRPNEVKYFPTQYIQVVEKLRGQDAFRQEYYPAYAYYVIQDGNVADGAKVALKTFLSEKKNHFLIVWEGYYGNLAQESASDNRLQARIPDVLYFSIGSFDPNLISIKYISITDIYDEEALEVGRELISRLRSSKEGAGYVSLQYKEVKSLHNEDPRKATWLALSGLPQVIFVSKMLKTYSGWFPKASFSAIHIWYDGAHDNGNSVQPSLAIFLELNERNRPKEEIVNTAFQDSVKRGLQNINEASKVEKDIERIMQEPDKAIPPLPKDVEMDLSWSGGQEYPFTAWLKALENPWRSAEVFLRSGKSYKKVHLKERLRYDRARIVFWSTVSAEDKHLAYWWMPEAIEKTNLVDWIYQCWVAGSHYHPEPELYPDNFYNMPSTPSTNLKYITIWDIHNPETIKILREAYETVYPDPEELLTQGLYLERKKSEDNPSQSWPAILGTKEIGEINELCVKYPKGMRGAQIANVDIVFQAVNSVEHPLRVSVIIGLHTEEHLIDQAGEPNALATISEDAAILRLDVLNTKRLRIQVIHSGIAYHRSRSVLEARTSYKSSQNPSYIQVQSDELTGPGTAYSYDFDISSQEKHISLNAIEDNPNAAYLPIGRPLLSKNQYLEQHLGDIIFSTWFAQEGWSKIKDVTFAKTSDSIRNFAAILLGGNTKDLTLSIPNDGGNDFKDILNFFLDKTLEGKSIEYLQKHRTEFLVYPEIQSLELASYELRGKAELLMFVRFGVQLQSDKNEPIDQVMERLLYEGIKTGRENELLTQQATANSQFGHFLLNSGDIYKHGDTNDIALLSRFNFRKRGGIDSPLNLPTRIASKLQHSGGAKLNAYTISKFKYLSASVENKANSLVYHISVSEALGNIVIMDLPEETQLPEQLSADLTDVIYATWTKFSRENFIFHKIEDMNLLNRIGIRAVTFLELSPETKRIIAEIRTHFAEEIDQKGFIEFRDEMNPKELSIFDKHTKSQVLTSFIASRSRIWLTLLGTPEVSAIGRIYPKYQNQLNKIQHIPRSIHGISIVWILVKGEEKNEELPVLLVNLHSGVADANTPSNPDQKAILNSQMKNFYLGGDVANFCERFCGLGNPLPDSGTSLDRNIFHSKEVTINKGYRFGLNKYKSGALRFPWTNGLDETIWKHVKKLESCRDYSVVVFNDPRDAPYWLEVSQRCHHMALSKIPDPITDITPDSEAVRRRTLAAAFLEGWNYRPIQPSSGSASLPFAFAPLEYISIEKLSGETLRILTYMGELWSPKKVDLRYSTLPIIDFSYVRLFRSSLFYGKTQGIHAWNLLLGSVEIGAIADMIRLYPTTMRGHRIESIVIWPIQGGARALVRIGRPDVQTS
ncbi:hypothetical protein TWF506_011172 [Arthrobotrys conoides]|uniref:Uncharacterized protein n=1 Tax=Arthrobotrys conoides TaxID=74498 RepID=A0AAN8RVC6_9PEZI